MRMSFFLIGIGIVAGVVGLEILAIKRWDGIWRWLAAAPLMLMAIDAVWIYRLQEPASHPHWYLELMLVGTVGLPAVGFLWLAREVSRP
jgi:hypothetical protein